MSKTDEHPSTARPNFRRDQLLTAERLNRAHEILAHRLQQAVFGIAGSGVVHGLGIKVDPSGACQVKEGELQVGCGLAFDDRGRQLFWPGGLLGMSQIVTGKPKEPGCYGLYIHYGERNESSDNRCGCDPLDADWVHESMVFTLEQEGDGECSDCGGEAPCPEVRDDCLTVNDYVCGRTNGRSDGLVAPDKSLKKHCKPDRRLDSSSCGEWEYDAEAGIRIARVPVIAVTDPERLKCGEKFEFGPGVAKVCSCRKHVYRTPLLRELIRGCHLRFARIQDTNVRPFLNVEPHHRDTWSEGKAVPWEEFLAFLRGGDGITVQFSKGIRESTLHSASVFITVVVAEPQSPLRDVLRMPATVEATHVTNGLAGGVRLRVSGEYLDNYIDTDRHSRFNDGAIVELTIRGAQLRDSCDRMLDARPLDIESDAPGESMVGDDFVVAFCVGARPAGKGKGHGGGGTTPGA